MVAAALGTAGGAFVAASRAGTAVRRRRDGESEPPPGSPKSKSPSLDVATLQKDVAHLTEDVERLRQARERDERDSVSEGRLQARVEILEKRVDQAADDHREDVRAIHSRLDDAIGRVERVRGMLSRESP